MGENLQLASDSRALEFFLKSGNLDETSINIVIVHISSLKKSTEGPHHCQGVFTQDHCCSAPF